MPAAEAAPARHRPLMVRRLEKMVWSGCSPEVVSRTQMARPDYLSCAGDEVDVKGPISGYLGARWDDIKLSKPVMTEDCPLSISGITNDQTKFPQ